MQPSIGIIISVYRQWEYLAWAITSIKKQKFQNWKLYVISDEDGKHDGSWMGEIETDRIVLVRRDYKNLGQTKRFNQGLDLCKEDYVMFMGADDTLDEYYLSSVAEELEKHPGEVWVYGDCINRYPGNKMKVHKSGEFSRKRLQKENYIPAASVVCNTNELRRIKFNEDLKVCEDWEMWLVLSKFYKPKYISEIAYNRWDERSVTRKDFTGKNKWVSLKRRINRKLIKRKFRFR